VPREKERFYAARTPSKGGTRKLSISNNTGWGRRRDHQKKTKGTEKKRGKKRPTLLGDLETKWQPSRPFPQGGGKKKMERALRDGKHFEKNIKKLKKKIPSPRTR